MKNKEYFAKEIAEVASNGCKVAVNAKTGTPMECNVRNCNNCKFEDDGTVKCCHIKISEWMNQDYTSDLSTTLTEYANDFKCACIGSKCERYCPFGYYDEHFGGYGYLKCAMRYAIERSKKEDKNE